MTMCSPHTSCNFRPRQNRTIVLELEPFIEHLLFYRLYIGFLFLEFGCGFKQEERKKRNSIPCVASGLKQMEGLDL